MKWGLFAVSGVIAVVVGALMVRACGDGPPRTALEAQGYTHIVIGGLDPFGCPKSYVGHYFTAQNLRGEVEHGFLCCNIFGSCLRGL